MPSIIQTDTLKDGSGTKTLADYSSSNWSWGSGLPSGSVIRTLTFETSNGSTTDSDVFIPLDGSNTSIQISDYTKGNKLTIDMYVYIYIYIY